MAREALLDDPCFPTKFYPIGLDLPGYVIVAKNETPSTSELPVPPQELWWDYAKSIDAYLSIGCKYVQTLNQALENEKAELKLCSRVLDFGCGSGIMLRWLRHLTKDGEVWGVDISGRHVLWCQENLSPPFKFVTTTAFPSLPFEDNYFDLIFAGSVFTHIADLIEFWLVELRRVLKPGGHLYVTVHDENTIARLKALPNRNLELWNTLHVVPANFALFTANRRPGEGSPGQSQVFYRLEYLRKRWGVYMTVLSASPNAYGHQTAVLLQK
jgi:SAM-dependent methyltransferase